MPQPASNRRFSQRQRGNATRSFSLPFLEFFRTEAAGGVVLLGCAALALIWANSPWSESYHRLWATTLGIRLGDLELAKSLQSWVKDALMVGFFFLVGLEIKRELLLGELASPRRAALPAAAAVGGALAPAVIYTLLNAGTPGSSGWGIPMATDIAFALGVLSLVGGPAALLLRIFLAALAIVDDLIAVLVIALFYSGALSWASLAAGALVFAALVVANLLGVRRVSVYLALGLALWASFLESGVHPTVAGVLLAMTIPARGGPEVPQEQPQEVTVDGHGGGSLLERIEHALNPWVAFGIMPIFALANAGVTIEAGLLSTLGDRIALGIVAGLIVGKQIGITLAAWLVTRLGLGDLPTGLGLLHVYGVSWLAGIGFTMSIFIAGLAFPDAERLNIAKVGIIAASAVAGAVGFAVLRMLDHRVASRPASAEIVEG
uniref:Na(+)/H(+) antiporter NhaA n=1 Tax=Thermorudis peleae TaxID=1382356 RepID=A0A831TB09_9BACT